MDELMDDRRGWMNRSRGFAEGVVVMICPVLLALALNKVDLNSEVYGRVVPVLMLVIASVTLISGICPLLACCFLERFPGCAGATSPSPAPVARTMAPVSSTCLLALACWMAQLVVYRSIAIPIGVLFGACVVAGTAYYYHQYRHRAGPNARRGTHGEINAAAADDADQLRGILDSSLEFLSGVTGILFLGLEGLALEGHNQIVKGGHGRQLALGLGAPMGTISFFVCALGVFLMFVEMMIPPRAYDTVEKIVDFTLAVDGIMATGTVIVLVVVMAKLMGPKPALLLLAPPFMMLLEYLVRETPGGGVVAAAAARRESKPASLELTRVTFTGFLAVSVTATSGRSPSMLTNVFLLFAGAAIVFGLSWRLLSQEQIRRKLEARANRANSDGAGSSANRANSYSERVASSANLASFCAHFCIVIATVLFAVMAGVAGDAKDQNNNAPAPLAGNGTAHMISSAQMLAPAHVITGCVSVILLFV